MRFSVRRGLVVLSLFSCAFTARAQTDVFPNLWVTDGPAAGIAVLEDTLFVAGGFGYVGPPTGQLAALDKATGEADLTWPRFESVGLEGLGINAIVADNAGGYFVGGTFAWVSGEPRLNLARVRADGTLDPDFRPDPRSSSGGSVEGRVNALAYDPAADSPSGTGVLYVGGEFDIIGDGEPRPRLAALDAGTGAVLPLATTIDRFDPFGFNFVLSLAARDGVLYVGGYFDLVGGVERRGVAALDGATGALLPWNADLRRDNPNFTPGADALALGDTTLYLSGAFDTVHGAPRSSMAEVSLPDATTGAGGAPTPWAPASGYASALLVVGEYVYATAFAVSRIDRQTGALEPLLPGYENANALAYDSTGEAPSGAGVVYVGLNRRDNDFDRSLVVTAVDAGTGAPLGFEVLGGTDDDPGKRVLALAVEPGPEGRILAGGSFLSLGGVARPALAALDLTTGRPTDFAADFENGFAEDLALSADGRFLYAYYFELGGAAISLKEYDLTTGTVREFFPPEVAGAPAAERSTSPAPGEAARVLPVPMLTPRGTYAAGPSAPPLPASNAAGTTYVANGPSALVVTDDRVCLSIALCLDRATTDVVWQQSAAIYLTRDNGDVIFVTDGDIGGTLYLAAPLSQIPLATNRAGFVALDYETGALLPFDPEVPWQQGAEAFAVARLDTDGDGPAMPSVYFGGDRIETVQGEERTSVFAVEEPTADLLPWAPVVSGAQAFPFEPVMGMLVLPRRAEDGGGGVVYVSGSFGVVNGEPYSGPVAAFDAVSGEHLPWRVYGAGADPTTYHVRSLVASPRHGALFLGGGFQGILRGSGHAGVVAVTPAAPFVPVAGEDDAPSAPGRTALSLAGPNPFTEQTSLTLTLPGAQRIEATLYDVLGRRVAVLHDGPLAAGTHQLEVSGAALPAGIYVVRVSGQSLTASRTLTLVR